MWGWIVGKIVQPFLPYVLGALVAAGLIGSVAAYIKGRADMNAIWQAKELESVINAQAQTIARYREASEQAKAQAAQEVREAQERAGLIEERMKQAEIENTQMESQLATLITDKEKLDAVVKSLKAACLATGSDVTLDQRLRAGKQGDPHRVPGAVVPRTRRPGTP